MIERYALVRGRISQEIENLVQVIERVEKGMDRALQRSFERLEPLVQNLKSTFQLVQTELVGLSNFLKAVVEGNE